MGAFCHGSAKRFELTQTHPVRVEPNTLASRNENDRDKNHNKRHQNHLHESDPPDVMRMVHLTLIGVELEVELELSPNLARIRLVGLASGKVSSISTPPVIQRLLTGIECLFAPRLGVAIHIAKSCNPSMPESRSCFVR